MKKTYVVIALIIFLVFVANNSLQASDETLTTQKIYAVGVYEGNIKTNGQVHGPQVKVNIDKTDNDIILYLGSYEPVKWLIEKEKNNKNLEIYVHGYGASKSKVSINGIADKIFKVISDLSEADEAKGRDFRNLVDFVSSKHNVKGLDGFWGDYEAPPQGFLITNSTSTKLKNSLQRDYLSSHVNNKNIKIDYEKILSNEIMPKITFDDEGFIFEDVDGNQKKFPISLDVPNVSWPVGAAYSEKNKKLYGVTLGGEGFLYQYDIPSKKWSVIKSMDSVEVSGMIYDEKNNRLIMGCCAFRGTTLMTYDLNSNKTSRMPLNSDDFAGLSDLSDEGNGHRAQLKPIAISNNEVLVKAGPGRFLGRNNFIKERLYIVNTDNNEVSLVDYQN